jgi:probable F420-dependent oxidoreductase
MVRPLGSAAVPDLGVTFASLQGLGAPLGLDVARMARDLGYRSFWTAEANAQEAFTVLGAVAATNPELDLGTGVLALQLRTPPLLAMAAATLQSLVPERDVLIGVGISSPVVAGRWHGAEYGTRPLAQTREFVTLLRACLSGEKVDFDGDFYRVKGFRLGVRLGERRPKIVVAALNERMLALGGELADGVLLNYLPASHVPWSIERVRAGGPATIYAYVHCGVTERDADAVQRARFDLFSYAVVDAYANSFRRAGFTDEVDAVREHHGAGDREGALAAISDRMIDAIDFVGDDDGVLDFVRGYVDAGVEVPVVMPLPWGPDRRGVIERTLNAVAKLAG